MQTKILHFLKQTKTNILQFNILCNTNRNIVAPKSNVSAYSIRTSHEMITFFTRKVTDITSFAKTKFAWSYNTWNVNVGIKHQSWTVMLTNWCTDRCPSEKKIKSIKKLKKMLLTKLYLIIHLPSSLHVTLCGPSMYWFELVQAITHSLPIADLQFAITLSLNLKRWVHRDKNFIKSLLAFDCKW